MRSGQIPGLTEFLVDYPLMVARPSADGILVVKGCFAFGAEHDAAGAIQDSFTLEICFPGVFPQALPNVKEIGGRIPRTVDFHVNSDGSLCLGSPLRLLKLLSAQPTIIGFAESCLVPYLYAMSHRLRTGAFPFGELPHYAEGMLADYMALFRLKHPEQARRALRLLGLKKRRANKLPCPCECGRRTGRCKFNEQLREFRSLASRRWFRGQYTVHASKPVAVEQKILRPPKKPAVIL